MKKLLLSATASCVLTTVSYAGGTFIEPETPAIEIIEPEISLKERHMSFGYIAGGLSMINVDSEPSASTSYVQGALDDQGTFVEIGAGYRLFPDIFITLAAQRTNLELAKIDNIYTSVNYQFNETFLKPYVGFIVGYSRLKWSERPDALLVNEDLISRSMMYGMQVGLEYSLIEDWKVFGKYQTIKYDHRMNIRALNKVIDHDLAQNALIGIKYEF